MVEGADFMAEREYNGPLVELVKEHGFLESSAAEAVVANYAASTKSMRQILVDQGVVSEDELLEVMAGYMGSRVVNLAAEDIPPDVVRRVPSSVARMYSIVPLNVSGDALELAVSDIVDPQVTDELMFVLTGEITFVFARDEDVRAHISQLYGDDTEAVDDMLEALEHDMEGAAELAYTDEDELDLESAVDAKPVIRFVNLVLYQAVKDRASDIHFEPFEKEFRIRYRVDGALYDMSPPPKRLALPVISRVKVMSNLDISERRLPQDGRIQLTIGGRPIDLRVSCLPTQFGESVVLRVLDQSNVSLEVENLGMPDDVYESYISDIEKPNGIIVVTGPTGSGKTTTLYSGLRRINTIERKLLTAEEPVEYEVEGIVQVPVSPATGNTFAAVLRAFLRQDPDVMMVGEIRDIETAKIAVEASLTGHLVFSTLHTNDAAGAVTRLIDMGVEPYLVSSTLEAIIGQRLVRSICESCKTAYAPDDDLLGSLGLAREDVGERPFYYGTGCAECNDTGYRGRRGIYEYLPATEMVRSLINERQPTLVIRQKAIEQGMRTMREDGIRKILDGYTTVEEVSRYT
jgi:type IV pilus assembly protein PilB